MYPVYYTQGYYRNPLDPALIKKIQKSISGEYSAIACYEQLARLAPTKEIRKQIVEIMKDEQRHYLNFIAIYTTLTGQKAQPKITGDCPKNYREGLLYAFTDEQETVDLYQKIADELIDPQMKETYRRAASDEQNHAVWFLYYLMGTR